MKVAILTTDNRGPFKQYDKAEPFFGTAPEALMQGFALLPEVEVHIVSCIRRPVQSPARLAPNIFFHSVVVPKLGWMRTGYQGCIRATRKKLKEIRPDIIHGQGTEMDCGISAVLSGFPNVLTIHGNMRLVAQVNQARPFSFLWLAARLERVTVPRADGVVCITHYTQAAMAGRARRTWVVPNAVDASFFGVQPSPSADQPPIFLCVGTVCQRKNQNAFIRSLDQLAREKQFKLIFLGQAEKDSYGEEFLGLVRGRQWCEHVGFADRNRLKGYFKTASGLALPTLEDNCPMVVLEAMAAGVPVLASKVGGVPDLIEEGRTGLFCDPQRPESFCAGMSRLLADRKLAQQLAANAKVEAQHRFHPSIVARRHLDIYREVLGR